MFLPGGGLLSDLRSLLSTTTANERLGGISAFAEHLDGPVALDLQTSTRRTSGERFRLWAMGCSMVQRVRKDRYSRRSLAVVVLSSYIRRALFCDFCEKFVKHRVPSPPGAWEPPQRGFSTQLVAKFWQLISRRSLAVVVLSN